ncbi:MutS protein msh5 [Mortierella sp. AD010]|nr:MutS protein msh5 [Mortierella sp. AD010]
MDHNSTAAAQTRVSSHNRKRRRLAGTDTHTDSVIDSESVLMPESTSVSTPEQDESNCAQVSTKTIDGVPESAISSNSGRRTESSSPRESTSAIAATTSWSVSTGRITKCPNFIAASSAAATHRSGAKSIESHSDPKEYQSTQLKSPQISPTLSSTSSAIRRGDSALHVQPPPAQDTKAPRRMRAKTRFPEQRPIADLDQRRDSQSHSQHPSTPAVNLSIAESDCGDSTSIGGQQSLWQQGQDSVDYQTSSEPQPGHEIIMAINAKGRTMGFSYYDGQLAKLFVMQDMAECNPVAMAETVKVQLRPTLILTNARLDDNVMDALRFDETGHETKIEIRPGSEFSYPVAKSRLISVSINISRSGRISNPARGLGTQTCFPEMDESALRNAQLRLSNSIDLESTESVGCAGAIVNFLSRRGISHRTTRGGCSLAILAIESFAIDSHMFININSLSSLQIFEDESHPSMHSSIRGRKEGLSLYGILNHTKTSQGRYLLKQWLLRPSLDLSIIHARQQSVECFSRTENQPTVGQLASSLSHIKNIPKVLQTLPRKATISEWQAILQILQQFVVKELVDIGTFINDVLDFDESVIEGRCVVKHNVDEELDRMRHTYHGLDSFLSDIAKEISQTIPSDFTSTINVIYFPQLGYLITVPMNPDWKTDQDFYLEGLSYQFSTESTVYYKNDAMRDREIDILQGLQERILEYSQMLVTCSDICAELDVLVSLAQVARLRDYKRPTLTKENILHIVKGRWVEL